jgi:hypothetical protein
MTIEKGDGLAGFLDRLGVPGVGLEEKLVQGLDERDIEAVEPNNVLSRVVGE